MIKDLAELAKFLKLCRKQGVREIKVGDLSVTLGELPQQRSDDADDAEIPTDEPTMEQLMFLSAGGQQ